MNLNYPTAGWLIVAVLALCFPEGHAIAQVSVGGAETDVEDAYWTIVTEDAYWTIGVRSLPPPIAASEILRESIADASQPSVDAVMRHTPSSGQEWEDAISAKNAATAKIAQSLAERWSVNIAEDEISGVTVRTLTPTDIDPANANRLFVHLHGGAYVLNGGMAGVAEAILIAHRARIQVLSIDYRQPPQHPFPAAIDDVVAVWKYLLEHRRAKSMALGGTSAGGGLTLASTHRFIELELETPGALWAGTPWADLTKTSDSHFTLEGIDRMLVTYDGVLEAAAKLYASGKDLRTPLISPVYGDFDGFPPTYLVTGTRDLFLGDTIRVHRKMRVAGAVADLNVYEGLSHGEYAFLIDSPESVQTFEELRVFLLKHLDKG